MYRLRHITPHARRGAGVRLWGRAHHTASPGASIANRMESAGPVQRYRAGKTLSVGSWYESV